MMRLDASSKVVWIVTFYAAWSPACINFTHVFSKLSADYSLPNLKFGKVDVGRCYPWNRFQLMSQGFSQ